MLRIVSQNESGSGGHSATELAMHTQVNQKDLLTANDIREMPRVLALSEATSRAGLPHLRLPSCLQI